MEDLEDSSTFYCPFCIMLDIPNPSIRFTQIGANLIEAEMGNRNGRGWCVYKLESPVPETETSPREAQNESRKCNSKHWMEQWVYRRAWLVQLTCILNIVLQIDDGETRAENVHSIPGHMERPLNAWWIVNIQFPTDFYLLSRSLCCLTRWAVVSVERQYFAWPGN